MSLKERLQKDLKKALRERDAERKAVIRIALTDITNAEVEKRGELDDQEIVAVLRKQAREREETIEELRDTDRSERLAEQEARLAILQAYLPDLLSREEIVAEAEQVIEDVGATSMREMGPVMGRLMAKLKGRADGHEVNQVVRELLSG